MMIAEEQTMLIDVISSLDRSMNHVVQVFYHGVTKKVTRHDWAALNTMGPQLRDNLLTPPLERALQNQRKPEPRTLPNLFLSTDIVQAAE
jgi:hypothetical protein